MNSSLKRQLAGLIHAIPPAGRLIYRVAFGPFGPYLAYSWPIPGWLGRNEGLVLAQRCYDLPPNAVIVEIGSFLGKSAVMFAGARRLQGSGVVHCIDPFDASGDAFSVPVYQAIAGKSGLSLRQRFDANIARAGLTDWIRVHQGTAASVATGWAQPIDLLFLDGDHSPEGAQLAYRLWMPFLKVGGIIALHNSTERVYDPSHEGTRLLAQNTIRPPQYGEIVSVDVTTVARKLLG
jgi:predicted O-methyltransferase YrrM